MEYSRHLVSNGGRSRTEPRPFADASRPGFGSASQRLGNRESLSQLGLSASGQWFSRRLAPLLGLALLAVNSISCRCCRPARWLVPPFPLTMLRKTLTVSSSESQPACPRVPNHRPAWRRELEG